MEPLPYEIVYRNEEIAARVAELGREISPWVESVRRSSGRDPVLVPLLRGALVFSSDLARVIDGSIEVAPLAVESYDPTQNVPLSDSVVAPIEVENFLGRTLLVVDDVCDSGRTLESVCMKLRAAGAVEVKTVVIVNRVSDSPRFRPDWVGFNYKGPEWFVGYGMDDAERYRNLPSIYVMRRPQ